MAKKYKGKYVKYGFCSYCKGGRDGRTHSGCDRKHICDNWTGSAPTCFWRPGKNATKIVK